MISLLKRKTSLTQKRNCFCTRTLCCAEESKAIVGDVSWLFGNNLYYVLRERTMKQHEYFGIRLPSNLLCLPYATNRNETREAIHARKHGATAFS